MDFVFGDPINEVSVFAEQYLLVCQRDSIKDQIDKRTLESIFGQHKLSFQSQEKSVLNENESLMKDLIWFFQLLTFDSSVEVFLQRFSFSYDASRGITNFVNCSQSIKKSNFWLPQYFKIICAQSVHNSVCIQI